MHCIASDLKSSWGHMLILNWILHLFCKVRNLFGNFSGKQSWLYVTIFYIKCTLFFSHILKAFQQQSKREYERCIIVANIKSRAAEKKKVANHLPYEIRSENTAIINFYLKTVAFSFRRFVIYLLSTFMENEYIITLTIPMSSTWSTYYGYMFMIGSNCVSTTASCIVRSTTLWGNTFRKN